MQLKETTTYVTGAIQGARLISQHGNLSSAKKALSKARKKDPRATVFAREDWFEALKLRKAGKKVEAPEVPEPKKGKKKEKPPVATDGEFQLTQYFRDGSCKQVLAATLSDGKEHEVLELKRICDEHGLKTYQVINFTTMRLRQEGFTVVRGGGTVRVTASS
jgi:hypothetical protein